MAVAGLVVHIVVGLVAVHSLLGNPDYLFDVWITKRSNLIEKQSRKLNICELKTLFKVNQAWLTGNELQHQNHSKFELF